ncbi:hypothetical protein B0H67DRAFT_640541 [Lasiosphaeris hirsuta]|uniref:Uncharacterized protein n=1 Tax=Lasiosphaeris hirsuta TaxID=260670 RepID=A0AA40EBK7_9PEZI|nr:hypothetical protein B0H67DRAFT_640541 [Lasiosphaeris hirsuta]
MATNKPTSQIHDARNTGDTLFWGWLSEYLNAILGIAILGGQITFTVIVSDISDPPDTSAFSKDTVRFFIALSWLFFTSSLGLAVLTKVLVASGPLSSSGGPIIGPARRAFVAIYSLLTFLLNLLPIAAFMLLALAVAAYVPGVGWAGVALTGFFGILVLFLWFALDSGI